MLLARIKIRKAYILHDLGQDIEAKREAAQAEILLSLLECHEDRAELHNAMANIILSASKNAEADRKSVLLHLVKCIHYCGKAPLTKGSPLCKRDYEWLLFIWGITSIES